MYNILLKKEGKKRGQVTIFIILGIVILFAVGFTLYISNKIAKSDLEKQAEKFKNVPTEIRALSDLIVNCVNEVGTEGVNILGQKGGYIDIPSDIIPRSSVNKFSNSLELFPGYEVAYWFYESSSGIQKLSIPSIDNMEEQLNGYVNNNLYFCLNNLTFYQDQGYDVEFQGEINTQTKINDNSVEVLVNYPIRVSYKDINKVLDSHYTKIEIPLGDIYKIAKETLVTGNTEGFLENRTLDILILYDDIPYSGESFDCTPKIWLKQNVEKDLKEIIATNTDAFRIRGSINSNLENYYTIKINSNVADIESNFIFNPEWPFDLKINGGEEILKEESLTGTNKAVAFLMTAMCMNNYHFIYDIKYPVLLQISKEDYVFQFATQVIIDNNQPKENKLGSSSLDVIDDKVCKYKTGEIEVFAIDQQSNQYINNADVKINCIGAECDLGKTTKHQNNDISLLTSTPKCLNSKIIVEKDGYTIGETIVNTNLPSQVFVYLNKKYPLKVNLRIIDNNVIRPLKEDESAVVLFLHKVEDFSSTYISNSNNTLDLIPGDYDVKIYITKNYNNPIQIPEQNIEYCTDVPRSGLLGLLGLKKEVCRSSKFDSLSLDQAIIGGVEFEYSIDESKLRNSDEITLTIIVSGEPRTIEDLQDIYAQITDNKNNPSFSLPELK